MRKLHTELEQAVQTNRREYARRHGRVGRRKCPACGKVTTRLGGFCSRECERGDKSP